MDENSSEQKDQTLGGKVSELMDTFFTYIKEQIEIIVQTKITEPVMSAAKIIFSSMLAAGVFGLAVVFLAVAAVLLLLELMPAWVALGIMGLLLAAGGVAILVMGKR